MSIISNTALAFSMSADAFAAAIGKGATLHQPKLRDALRMGAIFGMIESLTPLIGWAIGLAASSFIASFDHWLAFIILCCVGVHMIHESMTEKEDKEKIGSHRLTRIILVAVGTSIDAMAVGVTLALVGANIILSALMIGTATFLMVTIGIMFGHYMGQKMGKISECTGGIVLILIGTHILYDHLHIIG